MIHRNAPFLTVATIAEASVEIVAAATVVVACLQGRVRNCSGRRS